MKALVFGATGLIGSHLVQKLLKEGADVTGVSSGNNKKDIHSKKYHHVSVDISIGALNILELMVERGIKRLIHSSSVTVYGRPRRRIAHEDSPLNTIIVYGVSKLTAENYCTMFSSLHGLAITVLRYASVYGPGLTQRTALPIFIERAQKNEDIFLYGDGTRSQDYIYVDDVVEANILAAKKGTTGDFNIGR